MSTTLGERIHQEKEAHVEMEEGELSCVELGQLEAEIH